MVTLFICLVVVLVTSSCNMDDVIHAPEVDKYYRPATTSSSMQWRKVCDYTPAPGQFIGETKTGGFSGNESTAADAIAYAEARMRGGSYLSLGGFGGYVVVGFDHSIDNVEGYDLAIKGNSFNGSSEPGIVWVMRDENGNSLPDDTWYELAGSETGAEGTIRDYSVTYYRPAAPKKPVKWVDSEGVEGQIDYLSAYHTQPYYYPQWIEADSYTLTGTKLKERNYDSSGKGSYWVLPEYDWGYVDNFSSIDRTESDKAVNVFDISRAIDSNGAAVELKYIDFVKVVTACNTKSGWLGELSTEVFDIYDI